MRHEVWRDVAARTLPAADVAAPSRLLLVGELNPYGAEPAYALFPNPPSSAGGRLSGALAIVPSRAEQVATWRANLCDDRWRNVKAVERAQLLLEGPWRGYVCLGAKVQSAFRQAILRNRAQADKRASARDAAHAYSFANQRVWDSHGAHPADRGEARCVWDLSLDVVRDEAPTYARFLYMPHPSGLCRAWNDVDVIAAARLAYADLRTYAS